MSSALGLATIGVAIIACAGSDTVRRDTARGTDSVSASADSSVRARTFVQNFYDWYTPTAAAQSSAVPYWQVLQSGTRYLSVSLDSLLRADSLARTDPDETRESLNFDPFLASQDPCSPFEAGAVTKERDNYRVTIHRGCAELDMQSSAHQVEVAPVAGQWRIVNVYYESDNLVSLLCNYARADKRTSHRPMTCDR